MSHELTVFEWTNRLTNEFNELRIAASDVIKMKTIEFFSDASVFIVNHSSELLYGSLSAFMVVIFTILLNRALNAENKVHELDRLLARSEQKLSFTEKLRDGWKEDWITLDAENDRLLEDVRELTDKIEDSELAFAAMREELNEKLTEVTEQRDEIQTEFDDMESDRNYWMESSSTYEQDAATFEYERDEAQTELENLKSAVPQLAYAA
ncbi:putative TMhelix containing protein [Vibrio phage 409E50-1]|nr:putative TMhelix containing protein [Vibrio phage 521E56-1]CAH9012528.1 putative TMhelix containing protein [Vibrio phage 384E50-1]CAH9012567.1 putative TMhelix containing protein [Vibrio phage 409E50-1]CAH9012577.1 putative TMhelix containing protein [Vibrio phage 402E50-1]CAH9013524.1 putative TMhelix containing protein [Vibrio phage 405E50-1]CAH9013588.1 putative TMhelix containing protein [Vibrio phage 413E50-1]